MIIMPFCAKCGKEHAEEDLYCSRCGASLKERGDAVTEVVDIAYLNQKTPNWSLLSQSAVVWSYSPEERNS